jgi:hypothetical protein
LLVTANVVPRSLIHFALMMEVIRPSETSILIGAIHVTYQKRHSSTLGNNQFYFTRTTCPTNLDILMKIYGHLDAYTKI